jgi:hypothetical protein
LIYHRRGDVFSTMSRESLENYARAHQAIPYPVIRKHSTPSHNYENLRRLHELQVARGE